MSDLPPPLVESFNPSGRAPVLMLCDHAGRFVPEPLADLGLDAEVLGRHIGWDIGAAEVARILATALDAPLLLSHVSRLVIDPNRRPFDPTSIPEISDGVVIPGNQKLDRAEMLRRVRHYFLPYHRRVARRLGAFRRAGIVPVLLSVHSFTPMMAGEARPWQIGVVWRGDARLAAPVLAALQAEGDLVVGDNQPYSGLADFGFTVTFHAQRARLPHLMLEIRQDEIDTPDKAAAWAARLLPILRRALARPGLNSLFDGDNLPRAALPRGWREASHIRPHPLA